jgi:hypothetical protein
MPNGPTQVAGGFIDAMRGNPLALALVAMNLGLLGFLYYGGVVAHTERQREMELLYENRTFVAKLLAECQPIQRER